MENKRLALTSGEPAGIGADIILSVLADNTHPLLYVGDCGLLRRRAQILKQQNILDRALDSGMLAIDQVDMSIEESPGIAQPINANYVIKTLQRAAQLAMQHKVGAIVTAPVNKAIINQAGIPFSGHTEFFAEIAEVERVVMMLVGSKMRVVLVTTHLPLREVADYISEKQIVEVLEITHRGLEKIGIAKPRLMMAGLNPHAGEQGVLGREEIEIIAPAISKVQQEGIDVVGPVSADTMFTSDNCQKTDAFVCLYHDQGLPVIKAQEFGGLVNVTLGLPFIRVSVDHGTAFDCVGTGKASDKSLRAALDMARGFL